MMFAINHKYKHVLVFTDGKDTGSRVTPAELIEAQNSSETEFEFMSPVFNLNSNTTRKKQYKLSRRPKKQID